ncbi:MAG: hypothetical protein ABSA86_01725 [Oryzomonas sp.]
MKRLFNTVMIIAALLAAQGCATKAPPPPAPTAYFTPQEVAIERWADNNPEAAAELGNWVKNHPQAARKFFDWDGTHPDQSKIFVFWAISHSRESIDVFLSQHHDWAYFNELIKQHRPAAKAFINWCRHHTQASDELINHPGGLQWAGNHLYKAFWDMTAH